MGVLFVGKPFYLERAVGHSSTSACAYYFLNICLPEVCCLSSSFAKSERLPR